jgi:glycosyltransferase involved in cell wall biosynthesis
MTHSRDSSLKGIKLCLIGSEKPYPAFVSISSILTEILGSQRVTECRINESLTRLPLLIRFFSSMVQDIIVCSQIVRNHKKDRTNVVLIFQGYYPLTCLTLRLMNLKLILYIGGSGFRWSNCEHTSIFGRMLVYANIPVENICHKSANMIITLSKGMVRTVRIEKNMSKTYFALPRLDKEFFEKFGIINGYSNRENLVGFLGALTRAKGVLNLLESIKFLTSKKDIRFLFVGEGPLLEKIKSKVQSLGIADKVEVCGFIDNSHTVEYYNKMKLYILPSYAEGIPSTIFEAMACGTPVLVSPVGGIPDIVKNNENGFLLSSNDPRQIAARIDELLEDPEFLEKVSTKAYEYVRKEFSYKRTLECWRTIISEVAL